MYGYLCLNLHHHSLFALRSFHVLYNHCFYASKYPSGNSNIPLRKFNFNFNTYSCAILLTILVVNESHIYK